MSLKSGGMTVTAYRRIRSGIRRVFIPCSSLVKTGRVSKLNTEGKVIRMKKTFGVFVFDEHAEGPTYAVIEIDEDIIQRILELQVAVKKSHAWRIQTHHDDALI